MNYIYNLLIVLCFFLNCDCNQSNPQRAIPVSKDMVLIIDVNKEFPDSTDPRIFRETVQKITHKLNSQYRPSVVFIDNLFASKKLDSIAFAKSINPIGNLVLPYILTSSKTRSRLNDDLFLKFKRKFPAQKNFSDIVRMYNYTGIDLPTESILENTSTFCSNTFDWNEETDAVDEILAVTSFRDYYLNTCTLVLANEFVKKFGYKILYDPYFGNFIARSTIVGDEKFKIYLGKKAEIQDKYELPIKFEIYPTILSSELLSAENLEIPDNSIIIIKTTDFILKIGKDRYMSSVNVLASQIFSLMNSINDSISK